MSTEATEAARIMASILDNKDARITALEAENAKLRSLVQVLVDGVEGTMDQASFAMSQARLPITIHQYRRAFQQASSALAAAKEQGFTPTNTEAPTSE